MCMYVGLVCTACGAKSEAVEVGGQPSENEQLAMRTAIEAGWEQRQEHDADGVTTEKHFCPKCAWKEPKQ